MQTHAYERIAVAALSQYTIPQGQLQFLGHSGNVIFRIETPEKAFVLRIHQAVSGLQDDIWQRLEIIESELLWLSALHHDTTVVVQEPVQNRAGKWVTQVVAEDTREVFHCSLLRWIDGHTCDTQRTPQQAHQLGSLIAQMHRHTSQWQLPQNFVRPSYDESRLDTALSMLHPAVAHGLISTQHYEKLVLAAQRVQKMIKTMSQTPEIWGVIHADLHEGNYLFHNEQIRPIDFSRCGFGYYLYDIAQSLQYLFPEVRFSFFEGYQTFYKLPEHYTQHVEGFLIMALIEVFSFHVNNPKEHQWLSETIQYVVEKHVHSYLEGKAFLFDVY